MGRGREDGASVFKRVFSARPSEKERQKPQKMYAKHFFCHKLFVTKINFLSGYEILARGL